MLQDESHHSASMHPYSLNPMISPHGVMGRVSPHGPDGSTVFTSRDKGYHKGLTSLRKASEFDAIKHQYQGAGGYIRSDLVSPKSLVFGNRRTNDF